MPTGTFHQNQLDVRCRVCGRKRDPGRTHKLVGDIVPELLSSFNVDVVEDVDDRHPRRICSTCFSYVRAATSDHGNRSPSTSIVPKRDGRNVQGMIAIGAINGRRRIRVVGQESRRAQKEAGLQVHMSPAQ